MTADALSLEIESLLAAAATAPEPAHARLEAMEAEYRAAGDAPGLARVLEARARVLIWAGRNGEARRLSDEGLGLLGADPPAELAAALHAAAGLSALYTGQEAESADHLVAAIDGFRALGIHDRAASALNSLAILHCRLGDLIAAERCFSACAAEQHAAGHAVHEAVAWDNLGIVRTAREDAAGALACFEVSGRLFADAGDERRLAGSRVNRAWALFKLGRHDESGTLVLQALGGCERTGFAAARADAERLRAALALARGDAAQAETHGRDALARAGSVGDPELRIECLFELADAVRARGGADEARGLLSQASALAARGQMRAKLAEAERRLHALAGS